MNVSEYIVKFIEKQGIDTAFAVVGGASLWLDKALSEADLLKTVFTNHEQAATMAADGYARVSGKAGVVFTINGPGMTNTVTGIAQAWVDSSPVILITGNSNSSSVEFERKHGMRQYGTQDVNTAEIMAGITKKTFIVNDPNKIRIIMEEAYELAVTGRKGPVCVEIPINIQSARCDDKVVNSIQCIENEWNSVDEKTAERIITMLREAERPLILAGQGVRLAGAVSEFNSFIEMYDIPVVTSRMGNDIIESDSRLFVGRPGNHGSRASHFAIQKCDVLMIIGSRLAPNTTGYNVKAFSNQSKKILVEIDDSELKKKDMEIDITLKSDIKLFLDHAINMGKRCNCNNHDIWVKRCDEWKNKYPIVSDRYYKTPKLSTYRVVDEISHLASEGDIIFSDTGSCCSIVAQTWNIKRDQRLFISGGLSAMGYWSTCIGAGIAKKKENRLIVFVGDGSLQMNIHELATIKKYNIPVIIFVISNDGYQFVRMSQGSYNFEHSFGTSVKEGVPIPNIRKVVEAYGIPYCLCDEHTELKECLSETLLKKGPLVCEVFVDPNQEVCPRIKSIARKDGTFEATSYENLYPFLDKEVLDKEMGVHR